MARRRMLDPNIWEDEHFGKLSDKAKILFISCISNADDDGRLSGNPSNLRAIAFRFDDITIKRIEDLVQELSENLSHFVYYDVNGCNYIQLDKWEEYQSQRDDRRVSSRYPNVDKMSAECPHKIREVKLSKDKISKDKVEYDSIITDLNLVLGTSYKTTSSKTRELIDARLNDGYTLEEFKLVHRKMLRSWGNDEKMVKFLRPQTLYSPKFESYLQQKETTTKLTEVGVKTYLIGQEWLKNREIINVK